MVYINRPNGCIRLRKMSDNSNEEENNMLNGIYNNENIQNSSNYVSRESNIVQLTDAQRKYATSPFKNSHFVDEMQISNEALDLYQRELDVKKFTSLALSNEDDFSHLEFVEQAFLKGVKSPFSDDNLEELLNNQKLWDDING